MCVFFAEAIQFVVDFFGCDSRALNSKKDLLHIFHEAVKAIGRTVVQVGLFHQEKKEQNFFSSFSS